MKKYQALFGLHVLFWLLVIVPRAFVDPSVTLFGRQVPLDATLSLGFLPILLIVSWGAGRGAPSRPLRNYFTTFRWIGIGFWFFTIFWILGFTLEP